jgi:hypothetical protein
VTLIVLVAFGVLTGLDAPKLQANLPTPWVGVWERISVAADMLWVAVLAITLMRRPLGAGLPVGERRPPS